MTDSDDEQHTVARAKHQISIAITSMDKQRWAQSRKWCRAAHATLTKVQEKDE